MSFTTTLIGVKTIAYTARGGDYHYQILTPKQIDQSIFCLLLAEVSGVLKIGNTEYTLLDSK